MGWQLTPFLKLRVDVCQEPKAYDMYEIWKEMEKTLRNFKKREGGKQREKQRGTAHVNQQKVDWKNKLKERISRPPLHLSLCNIQTLRRLPLLNARRHALNICPALRLIASGQMRPNSDVSWPHEHIHIHRIDRRRRRRRRMMMIECPTSPMMNRCMRIHMSLSLAKHTQPEKIILGFPTPFPKRLLPQKFLLGKFLLGWQTKICSKVFWEKGTA